jgi:multidrug efflux pump subunit AcrA (membrane-fusion protein)
MEIAMNTDIIRRRKWKIAAAALLALVGGAAASQSDFKYSTPSVAIQSGPDSERLVTVVSPEAAPAATDLLLPAQLLPFEQTTLYARTDGFIAKWNVDRGARVKTGDLLATIDAPELDQQSHRAANAVEQGRTMLDQLKADLDQAVADVESSRAQVKVAEANREFAAAEFIRLQTAGSAVSRSDFEAAARNRDAANAQLVAARAVVNTKQKFVATRSAAIATQESSIRGLEFEAQRLRELQGFKRITAPFDGTITRRYAEVGMLISTITPQPLFHIQNSSTLRVQVDVPQGYAAAAKKARSGDVIVPESPNKPVPAVVARTANAIDPVTRTLRVELELPNADRSVFAGTYVQVRLALAPSKESQLVPIAALRYTPQGIEVVDVSGGTARALPVKVGRDYGRAIEVIAGLKGDEILVVNPSDGLVDGQAVRWNNERKPQDGGSAVLARAWPAAQANR